MSSLPSATLLLSDDGCRASCNSVPTYVSLVRNFRDLVTLGSYSPASVLLISQAVSQPCYLVALDKTEPTTTYMWIDPMPDISSRCKIHPESQRHCTPRLASNHVDNSNRLTSLPQRIEARNSRIHNSHEMARQPKYIRPAYYPIWLNCTTRIGVVYTGLTYF
ncbi:hypothetical protein GGR57DRAFT_405562 [Xylariaceae sp. FL1272]|nr:hypothetical protein GGR57DRAFT_405562 [Xylariaceae sp. FL1272]